ncbi:MAG: histidine triad nucleotide-binding protein, partial [Bdellovibrionales bacterium]|nr:histidine triad nucleotide-binding protein [Bdellovibrionales bacterium]
MSEDTIFHKIINREIPADIVFEDSDMIVIRDINPVSDIHLLLIPKKTMPSLSDAAEGDAELLGAMLLRAAKLASDQGIAEDGYRVVINTGGCGGQTVFQLHM